MMESSDFKFDLTIVKISFHAMKKAVSEFGCIDDKAAKLFILGMLKEPTYIREDVVLINFEPTEVLVFQSKDAIFYIKKNLLYITDIEPSQNYPLIIKNKKVVFSKYSNERLVSFLHYRGLSNEIIKEEVENINKRVSETINTKNELKYVVTIEYRYGTMDVMITDDPDSDIRFAAIAHYSLQRELDTVELRLEVFNRKPIVNEKYEFDFKNLKVSYHALLRSVQRFGCSDGGEARVFVLNLLKNCYYVGAQEDTTFIFKTIVDEQKYKTNKITIIISADLKTVVTVIGEGTIYNDDINVYKEVSMSNDLRNYLVDYLASRGLDYIPQIKKIKYQIANLQLENIKVHHDFTINVENEELNIIVHDEPTNSDDKVIRTAALNSRKQYSTGDLNNHIFNESNIVISSTAMFRVISKFAKSDGCTDETIATKFVYESLKTAKFLNRSTIDIKQNKVNVILFQSNNVIFYISDNLKSITDIISLKDYKQANNLLKKVIFSKDSKTKIDSFLESKCSNKTQMNEEFALLKEQIANIENDKKNANLNFTINWKYGDVDVIIRDNNDTNVRTTQIAYYSLRKVSQKNMSNDVKMLKPLIKYEPYKFDLENIKPSAHALARSMQYFNCSTVDEGREFILNALKNCYFFEAEDDTLIFRTKVKGERHISTGITIVMGVDRESVITIIGKGTEYINKIEDGIFKNIVMSGELRSYIQEHIYESDLDYTQTGYIKHQIANLQLENLATWYDFTIVVGKKELRLNVRDMATDFDDKVIRTALLNSHKQFSNGDLNYYKFNESNITISEKIISQFISKFSVTSGWIGQSSAKEYIYVLLKKAKFLCRSTIPSNHKIKSIVFQVENIMFYMSDTLREIIDIVELSKYKKVVLSNETKKTINSFLESNCASNFEIDQHKSSFMNLIENIDNEEKNVNKIFSIDWKYGSLDVIIRDSDNYNIRNATLSYYSLHNVLKNTLISRTNGYMGIIVDSWKWKEINDELMGVWESSKSSDTTDQEKENLDGSHKQLDMALS